MGFASNQVRCGKFVFLFLERPRVGGFVECAIGLE